MSLKVILRSAGTRRRDFDFSPGRINTIQSINKGTSFHPHFIPLSHSLSLPSVTKSKYKSTERFVVGLLPRNSHPRAKCEHRRRNNDLLYKLIAVALLIQDQWTSSPGLPSSGVGLYCLVPRSLSITPPEAARTVASLSTVPGNSKAPHQQTTGVVINEKADNNNNSANFPKGHS